MGLQQSNDLVLERVQFAFLERDFPGAILFFIGPDSHSPLIQSKSGSDLTVSQMIPGVIISDLYVGLIIDHRAPPAAPARISARLII